MSIEFPPLGMLENDATGATLTRSREREAENMTPESPFRTAVIIPTRDRQRDLVLAIESVFRQTIVPEMLVIVDQSAGTQSKESVERAYAAAAPIIRERLSLIYIHDPRISGGAEARNRAMDSLNGGIWLFLDDDVILEPRFIEEILASYEQHPEAAGISGIITNYARPSRAFRLWSAVFVRGPFFDDRQPVYWRANELRGCESIRVSRFGAGLMSFRAEVIGNIRFDAQLRGVSDGEDVDFCMKLGPQAQLFIAPRARLIHNHSPIGREQRHWLARTSRATFYLHDRHWRHGLKNRLCFLWFNVGCGLWASVTSVRQWSLRPWRAFLGGIMDAREVTRGAGRGLKTDFRRQGWRRKGSRNGQM